jgi:16S rRNA (guanine966-N2)-methyltransferase
MVRIVAGELRGRRLVAPSGRVTRPTADRVREAVFAILGPVEGLSVLDLFAGSGALALEALSRGAASATLVERAPPAVAAIRANLGALGLAGRARVVVRDWRAALAAERSAGRRYDLALIDPPYRAASGVLEELPARLAPVLAGRASIVLEYPAAVTIPAALPALAVRDRIDRVYGETGVSVMRLGPADDR